MKARSTRIALASTFYFDANSFISSCGLVKWCFSASSLAVRWQPTVATDVVIFSNNETQVDRLCGYATEPAVRVVTYPEDVVDLARRWASAVAPNWSSNSTKPLSRALSRRTVKQTVLKWYAVSRAEYRAILLTDCDVDFFFNFAGQAPAPLAAAWWRMLKRFLDADGEEITAIPDHAGPINTGVLLLKPNVSTWALGLRALQSMRWNASHGFEHAGPLRDRIEPALKLFCEPGERTSRMRSMRSMHSMRSMRSMQAAAEAASSRADSESSASPLDASWEDGCAALNTSLPVRRNAWTFVGGDADQGLYVHVYLGELRGRSFRPHMRPASPASRKLASVAVRRELAEASERESHRLEGRLGGSPLATRRHGTWNDTLHDGHDGRDGHDGPGPTRASVSTHLCDPSLSTHQLAATRTGRTCGTSLFARHFWAGAKPWRRASPSCVSYFDFLELPPFRTATTPPSGESCLALLRWRRDGLTARYSNNSSKADSGCGSPLVPLFPVG